MADAIRLPHFAMWVRRDEQHNLRQWSEVRSLQRPVWLKEVYDRISAVGQLGPNWDSYGGLPASLHAMVTLRVLLSNLSVDDLPKPHVAAVPDGGIGLHWRIATRDLELEVDSKGGIHALETSVGGDPTPREIQTLKQAQHSLDWVLGKI